MPEKKFFDTQSTLAMLLIFGIIGLAYLMMFYPIPESDAFKMFLGGLMTVGFSTVINFYFGSSKGSKEKDDIIGESAKAANETISTMVSGTGNGNGGPPGATTVKVTPPPPPDSAIATVTVTDTTKHPQTP